MFPAFDYNHEKDEYRNGYDNGQGDKGYDDGENEFASNGVKTYSLKRL